MDKSMKKHVRSLFVKENVHAFLFVLVILLIHQ